MMCPNSRYICWLWLSTDPHSVSPFRYTFCGATVPNILLHLQSHQQISFGHELGHWYSHVAWPHVVAERTRPTQSVSNERNTEPQGKYEHQVIWLPADSLSISDVSESKVVLTCAERLLLRGAALHVGNNLGLMLWSPLQSRTCQTPNCFPFFFSFSFHYTQITCSARQP